MWAHVMKLQEPGFGTAPASADIGASPFVACPHGAPHGRRHSTRTQHSSLAPPPRAACQRGLSAFELLYQLIEGAFDNGGRIAVWNQMPEQVAGALEGSMRLGADRHAEQVPLWCERSKASAAPAASMAVVRASETSGVDAGRSP
jgi:hypothetical protein